MFALPTPPINALTRLQQRPSWVNKAGRVDRCACLEVRASELWRRIPAHGWQETSNRTRDHSAMLAFGTVTVIAAVVNRLHRERLPRRFTGDLRTPKSNAMKSQRDPQRRRRLNRKRGEKPWTALPDVAEFLYANPNHGAAKSKTIALPEYGWQQVVRIERWRRGKRSAISGQHSAKSIRPTLASSPLPSPPDFWHYLICPACNRRVFMLMLVLAQPEEAAEARIAEQWIALIDSFPVHRRRVLTDSVLSSQYSTLCARYGQLFSGRRLICRKCLGVRYGEVRKSRRKCDPAYAAERSRKRLAAQAARDATRQAESDAALRELFDMCAKEHRIPCGAQPKCSPAARGCLGEFL